LLTGYCAPHTIGGKLLAGNKQVKIFGDLFDVRASIESIQSLSAHADYEEMIRYLSCQDKRSVRTIFLVHGEDEPKGTFRDKLLKEGYKNVVIPKKGEVFPLVMDILS
jgi:metallo-beta-lactamase family protein